MVIDEDRDLVPNAEVILHNDILGSVSGFTDEFGINIFEDLPFDTQWTYDIKYQGSTYVSGFELIYGHYYCYLDNQKEMQIPFNIIN